MTTTSLSDYSTARSGGRPILLTGGAVVTMDPDVPDLPAGDVLLTGSRIVAVGTDLRSDPQHREAAAAALVIDTRGAIVSPGFVDTHRHSWRTQLRRSIPDVTDLGQYVMSTLDRRQLTLCQPVVCVSHRRKNPTPLPQRSAPRA